MWYVYIVQCNDSSLYTGITSDVKRRVEEHNKGRGGGYTNSRRPVRLVYTEQCKNRSEALKRERQINHLPRAKKLTLISDTRN
ncbi:GIY-YIG nuclease family protein [candidate division TA06 bacterium]|uniref:GIY-YIG nuclease family protein n=1 Tax=candidate division TA06 bacterium TaxID=2250710 RepID=A0A523UWZ3_UNCT6|nr:MAG: GIY-YIG nuclease family protein [candidate division TA06 bacterium]